MLCGLAFPRPHVSCCLPLLLLFTQGVPLPPVSRAVALPAMSAAGNIYCKCLRLCQVFPCRRAHGTAFCTGGTFCRTRWPLVVSREQRGASLSSVRFVVPKASAQDQHGSRDWAGGPCAQKSCGPDPGVGTSVPPSAVGELPGGPTRFHRHLPWASLPTWGKPGTLTLVYPVSTRICTQGSANIFNKGLKRNISGFVGRL